MSRPSLTKNLNLTGCFSFDKIPFNTELIKQEDLPKTLIMKKVFFTLLISIGIISTANAQDASKEVKNVVKMELSGVFLGQFQFGYERALNSNLTTQLNAGVVSRTLSWTDETSSISSVASGFVVCPEIKYYVDEALRGFYLGTYGRFKQVNVNFKESYDDIVQSSAERKRTRLSAGLLLGYQEVINDRMTLDLFVAPQYVNATNELVEGNEELDAVNSAILDYKGAGLRFGFTLGVAF